MFRRQRSTPLAQRARLCASSTHRPQLVAARHLGLPRSPLEPAARKQPWSSRFDASARLLSLRECGSARRQHIACSSVAARHLSSPLRTSQLFGNSLGSSLPATSSRRQRSTPLAQRARLCASSPRRLQLVAARHLGLSLRTSQLFGISFGLSLACHLVLTLAIHSSRSESVALRVVASSPAARG